MGFGHMTAAREIRNIATSIRKATVNRFNYRRATVMILASYTKDRFDSEVRKFILKKAPNLDPEHVGILQTISFYSAIVSTLKRIDMSAADRDDMFQNVLLKMWENADDFVHALRHATNAGAFASFIMTSVRNLVLDLLEKEKKTGLGRSVSLVDDDENELGTYRTPGVKQDFDEGFVDAEAAVAEFLRHLKPFVRDYINLALEAGMKHWGIDDRSELYVLHLAQQGALPEEWNDIPNVSLKVKDDIMRVFRNPRKFVEYMKQLRVPSPENPSYKGRGGETLASERIRSNVKNTVGRKIVPEIQAALRHLPEDQREIVFDAILDKVTLLD